MSLDRDGPLFGPDRPAGRLMTGLICPDCTGVLGVEEEGKKGHLRFVCRVGHSFSSPTLLEAKERDCERALWSALDLLEETISLARELAGRARELHAPEHGRALEERIERGVRHAADLRRIAEANGPPALPELP